MNLHVAEQSIDTSIVKEVLRDIQRDAEWDKAGSSKNTIRLYCLSELEQGEINSVLL